MIVDFRVRPPYRSFLKLVVHSDERIAQFERMTGVAPARSAVEHSTELLITELDDAGVDVAVVVGRNTPTRGAVDNADVAEFVALRPDGFVGFGGVDVSDRHDALREYRRCADLGLTGVAICAGFSDPPRHVDDQEIYPLYEACQAEDVPLAITYSSQTGPDIEYSNPVHVDRVAQRFPRLRLVVAHAGWPWVIQMLSVALKHKNVRISPDFFAIGMPGAADYTLAADTFLRDQYVFASSYPIRPVGPTVAAFQALRLRTEAKERALWRNGADMLLASARLPAGVRERLTSAMAASG
ncbi:MAG: amidohydrolase family protein [Chloroflexi bacterium]|nr:amidohydrolase family protein [Chloroflexota bacterium]